MKIRCCPMCGALQLLKFSGTSEYERFKDSKRPTYFIGAGEKWFEYFCNNCGCLFAILGKEEK
jgi:hypothetical protein